MLIDRLLEFMERVDQVDIGALGERLVSRCTSDTDESAVIAIHFFLEHDDLAPAFAKYVYDVLEMFPISTYTYMYLSPYTERDSCRHIVEVLLKLWRIALEFWHRGKLPVQTIDDDFPPPPLRIEDKAEGRTRTAQGLVACGSRCVGGCHDRPMGLNNTAEL
ncbi:hypothetical protein DFP72DRAFT_1045695 [Ephemerocybe angulata]|uniref:Uncharacterized protein n=1 Tax=Ephemerocybe angulata TaxID=980116 RepID=A0A8H6M8P9_9AGAR|nr:hypothetical protein DFP72DRAFT_1045695 [Tulosesus angulatus]